MKIVPFVR